MNFAKKLTVILSLLSLATAAWAGKEADSGRWSEKRVNQWHSDFGWIVGCNFLPSTAINQLEMFQAETYDPETIDRELGLAESLGFNTVRVYLHDLFWVHDKEGFLERLDDFLDICQSHNIKPMLVIFDGVWHPFPKWGKQPEPIPHLHNSQWVQSPGVEILSDPSKYDSLKPYVQGLMEYFKDDDRILAWDLFNEPENRNIPTYRRHEPLNKHDLAMELLDKTFKWAREVNPSQPLTAGIWLDYEGLIKNTPIFQLMLRESDIITFHNYLHLEDVEKQVNMLKRLFDRPIICTEYMARGNGSKFDPILGYFKDNNVGAYNWGLVNGKSQTIYPWESWEKVFRDEPFLWHHDIFRKNGEPYLKEEVEYIRSLTGK